MPKGYASSPKTVSCITCQKEFVQNHHSHKYCAKACKRKAYQENGGVESTARQYKLISGNWEKYFARLCSRSFRRELLSKHDCVALLVAQDYKCALTGVELTCNLSVGNICKTNASIDRIEPTKGYTLDNVQLVCSVINKFRINTSIEEFVDWCKKVSDHALRK